MLRRIACAPFILVALVVVQIGSNAQVRPFDGAQGKPSIDSYIAPGYPYELVAAKKADRIAWLSYERGQRNVYTAVAPAYTPTRLTRYLDDDGIDLTGLRISDDGATLVFVRGHERNRDGWVANPSSDPDGADRTIWAARTAGGTPWKLVEGDGAVLSPDGRAVLHVKNGQIYRTAVSDVAAANANGRPSTGLGAGSEKPFITAWGRNSDPRWSPDGSRIAFVSNRGDHTLIGVYDVAKRTVAYVSPSVDHDTSPTWSADGQQIAFIRRPGTPFGQQTQAGTGSIGNPSGPAANLQQGRGGRGGRGGEPQGVESSIPGLSRASFSGGYTLSFWVANIPGGLNRDDGSIETPAREFWHSKPNDDTYARVNNIQFAGNHVIFQAEPEEWIRYYSVPIAGSDAAPIALTPGEGAVEHVALSADGASLFYATNAGDIDRRHIWRVPTAGGAATQITSGDDIETYPVVVGSGKTVAVLSAASARPQSVAVVSVDSGKPNVIFPKLAAAFPAADHVTPQNVTLTADDGVKFNNQVFVPKGLRAGEKRPAVVFVHGGPSRQMLLGYHYMHFYHMAYAVNQWLAKQGFVVMSVNYRSGIGYGKSFRTAPNTGGRGNAEYKDVLAAGKYLQTRSDVDPNRVGIWGLSYGGVLTAQALARNSDIFKVGVDLAGVHLWGNSIAPDSVSFQSSAIGAIGTWKSPVLLFHGDDDRNVAFAQTTGLVQLLRAHNVYHELIVFPDDVHDSLLYKRWIYTFDRTGEFLNRFIGDAARKTTTYEPGTKN
jgi:dipeptidyl aminopeptidase/acylaminoacyl peptidase